MQFLQDCDKYKSLCVENETVTRVRSPTVVSASEEVRDSKTSGQKYLLRNSKINVLIRRKPLEILAIIEDDLDLKVQTHQLTPFCIFRNDSAGAHLRYEDRCDVENPEKDQFEEITVSGVSFVLPIPQDI